VDDEPQVLVALEDLLADRFVVFKADSGDTALNMMAAEPGIAVVVTDQRMPQMSGDELLSKLGLTSDAMRILVTGFADLKAVIRAVNEGKIFAYVTKPWDQQDLLLKVEKAAEQFCLGRELAYERQLLRDLMNSTPDGIYFKDRQRRFLRANRAFAESVADVVPEALVGKRLEDLGVVSDVFLAAEANEEDRVLQEGVAAADIVRELRRNGTSFWFSETKAPIKTAQGDVIGLVGILRDITRQRTLEQQLAQAQKMEAIGQLAGGVSHDLNNLLAVIGGYGQLVSQALPPGDPKREDMAEILGATRRAENLIRQLLTFSRRQVVQPKILNLNDSVSSLEKILGRVISESIEIKTNLEPELALVRADANQIDQVILNLAVNARDAMPNGGRLVVETANVTLNGTETGSGVSGKFVVLSVSDTGVGMDDDTKKHIFEPFFTTKEVGKGTGLGLATVYGITQQCGGHIEVESALGRGTTFKIYLPQVAGAVSTPERRSDRPTGRYGGATVLLVEDNPAVRQMVGRILRERGYSVIEAAHPEEALAAGERQGARFDLVLTDVVMPRMSGPELVKHLRERSAQMRVLYMSGYAGAAISREAAIENEAYIEKPFTPDALVETIHTLLNSAD
jgi:PAS domain S-box-containing protein